MTGAGGYPAPALLNYFFLAAFFLAAFFLAFFLAAIVVSFKVNLGITYVRRLLRTPNTWCCERFRMFPDRSYREIRQFQAWCANSMPQ